MQCGGNKGSGQEQHVRNKKWKVEPGEKIGPSRTQLESFPDWPDPMSQKGDQKKEIGREGHLARDANQAESDTHHEKSQEGEEVNQQPGALGRRLCQRLSLHWIRGGT